MMPSFTKTIRFRLTLTYSLVVFGVGALILAVVYLVLSRSLEAQPITTTYVARPVVPVPGGYRQVGPGVELADVNAIERAINYSILSTLRWASLITLPLLFVVSMATGWLLSGRALAPVRRMAEETDAIGATDLSRRLKRSSCGDELDGLAATINGMLDRLERSFAGQQRLMGDASHELRNPLAVIRANTEMVLAADDVGPTDRRQAAQAVVAATDRMNRLVEDLLATSRRDAASALDVSIDLAWLALSVADDERAVARETDVTLEVTVPPGLVVAGDADALRRAVHNLVVNAVRYAPSGSLITIGGQRLGDDARLWVQDQGPGIAPEDLPRVFDRFWRAEGQAARHDGHSGLGLAIVRHIIESHGGGVDVNSVPGQGASFVLTMPLAGAELGPPGAGPVDPAPVATDRSAT